MQTLDKAKQKFEAQGREGVAEARVANRVNRKRASGVIIGAIPALIGAGVLLGGARHGGLNGVIGEGVQGATSFLRNSDGELDMPFFDFPSISINGGESQPSSNGDDGLNACPTQKVEITLGEAGYGEYVSTATYDLNSGVVAAFDGNEQALDPLWLNYFGEDNNGQNPNSPVSNDVVLRQLISIEDCSVR